MWTSGVKVWTSGVKVRTLCEIFHIWECETIITYIEGGVRGYSHSS